MWIVVSANKSIKRNQIFATTLPKVSETVCHCHMVSEHVAWKHYPSVCVLLPNGVPIRANNIFLLCHKKYCHRQHQPGYGITRGDKIFALTGACLLVTPRKVVRELGDSYPEELSSSVKHKANQIGVYASTVAGPLINTTCPMHTGRTHY
jgi:hypothetical protein